ncbi:MAG: hypothetical protein IPK66_16565 [Rhodospirillales bacterium]|nr:hypothetical protein [Rhodospirillales bacterium]
MGPPVLEQQVLSYDEVAKTLDEKILLLNIARVSRGDTVHFTSTSSIAATFDWTTTMGVGGQIQEPRGIDFLSFNLGESASENPTFSIIPVYGEEFTKRVVTPFKDTVFEFLVFQGGRIEQVMRLMGSGIEVQAADGRFVRFIENSPGHPREYEEFRRIADHLQWLNDNRQLFVRSLIFDEVLVDDVKTMPRPEDINNGYNMGLRWRQKPDGGFELTRLSGGRVLVSNFDPMALSDRERFKLNERIRLNPAGFAYVEIRPDGPGGDFALTGAIKLRSMLQMLGFLASSLGETREYEVAPDPRTGPFERGAAEILKINASNEAPKSDLPSVYFDGRYYTVNDTFWDRTSFNLLSVLFQTAVGTIENVSIPITIAK